VTFSIAGRCPESGMLGVAIATSSICVGSRCPWARAGVGAVATQNVTLPELAPLILDRLERGEPPAAALEAVLAERPHAEYRQVTVVDARGQIAHFTGGKTLGLHGVAPGDGSVAAGNLLDNDRVPGAIAEGFAERSGAHLAERLMHALECGRDAGGEVGPTHSAALLVVSDLAWPLVDLRVDWHDSDPIAAVRELWTAYEPQMQDYVTRALDPTTAPSYGVPGDE
jgi:uncharacterized Ntn-hydrolase superfamily protein